MLVSAEKQEITPSFEYTRPFVILNNGLSQVIVRLLHPLNAILPIFATPLGITIDCKVLQPRNALSEMTLVSSLIVYVSKFSGTFINFNPSFVYLTPYSSVIAPFRSSSVILGFRSLSKLSFAFSLPCFAALSYHSTAFL